MPPAKDLEQRTILYNRLIKRDRHLRKMARREGHDCYRVYDRDVPEIPLSVERYADAAVLYLYERPYQKAADEEFAWLQVMIAAVSEALGIQAADIHVKTRKRLGVHEQYQRAADSSVIRTVHENGLSFSVNLSDYLDTGLFMDHRPLRGMVRVLAMDKRVLNLFCYTGSFSVYALAGGALSVGAVDLSATYLAWAERNLVLNHLDMARYKAFRMDATQFLTRAAATRERYDIIILDPPTFSNSTAMDGFLDINRHWPELVKSCLALLDPAGYLLFSTNSRALRCDPGLVPAAMITDITRATLPEDFRHTAHRCWQIRHKA
jgi:23S rRNA G2069 N7-methylase RlmK/C1962 C5-methylase RlmI